MNFKKNFLVVCLISLSFLAQAQKEDVRENLKDFDQISVRGSFDVELKEGRKEFVKIELEKGDVKDVITEVDGSKLKIYSKKKWNSAKGNLVIGYKKLNRISTSGSSTVKTNSNISSDEFTISGSGSSKFYLDINCPNLNIDLSGSGKVNLEGKGKELDINLSGSGDVDTFSFKVDNANISISGSGDVDLTVEKKLSASISGSGSVRYRGEPSIEKIKVSGSGSVKKDD